MCVEACSRFFLCCIFTRLPVFWTLEFCLSVWLSAAASRLHSRWLAVCLSVCPSRLAIVHFHPPSVLPITLPLAMPISCHDRRMAFSPSQRRGRGSSGSWTPAPVMPCPALATPLPCLVLFLFRAHPHGCGAQPCARALASAGSGRTPRCGQPHIPTGRSGLAETGERAITRPRIHAPNTMDSRTRGTERGSEGGWVRYPFGPPVSPARIASLPPKSGTNNQQARRIRSDPSKSQPEMSAYIGREEITCAGFLRGSFFPCACLARAAQSVSSALVQPCVWWWCCMTRGGAGAPLISRAGPSPFRRLSRAASADAAAKTTNVSFLGGC